MTQAGRAIDCLVNVHMGDIPHPEFVIRVKEDYFKAGPSMLENTDMGALLEEMDALGVSKAILLTPLGDRRARPVQFVERHPERFSLGVGDMDVLRPMENIRTLKSFV